MSALDQEDARTSVGSVQDRHGKAKGKVLGIPRRTLGMTLLMLTVLAWTSSNFLASHIFADDTYSKPYFVCYLNALFFAASLIPMVLRRIQRDGLPEFISLVSAVWQGWAKRYLRVLKRRHPSQLYTNVGNAESSHNEPASRLLTVEDQMSHSLLMQDGNKTSSGEALTLQETVELSMEFCMLWFVANYLTAICLKYTTVASATILTSTSSVWTLLFGTWVRIETFSFKKVIGVLASLLGIALISRVDLSGSTDENRGSFPHKTTKQLAIGDVMALLSAILYGVYAVLIKKRIGDESRVDMPLFFGLVGLFNVVFMWPIFIILHFVGEEPFLLPPTRQIWIVVLTNSAISLLSDYTWAYAMLLTSPLLVTVGLSLTIPLSLIGQMILVSQYASATYWIGAVVVLLSFILISHETRREDDAVD